MANEISPLPTDHLHTIFVDSNIDTHLAMVVSLYDTISDVKAKIGAEHAICFQDIGEIDIQAIKVRRRGFFYNLADSMYVLNAFDGVQGAWFVYIDAVPMCTVKNQKVLPNKVTHEHLKHHDFAVPVCSVDKHQEIVFCELSPKNSGPDGQGSHNPRIDCEHRPTMLIDQEKNERRKDDCKNLGSEANDAMPSATCTHKTISAKRSKASQQDKLLESQSQHYVAEKKRGEKLKDGLHEEHLDVCRRGSKFSRSEGIGESNNSANVSQEINCDGKKEILATSSEGLLSKLPHENTISLQNPPVEKHTKKRKRKSSKSHEVAHFAMPSETVVVRSPQVTAEPQNAGKEANASFFSGKCPSEPNIEESLPNDERDMSAPHDTVSFLEVANQKETSHSMGVNKEPIKEQILQVNPEDQSERHVNSSQYTNVVVSLKEPAEARFSLQVVSEFPTKLFCNTEGLTSKLPHENTISLQNPSVEKHTKKRKKKSSKSHEVAHFANPSETVVVRSPQVTAEPQNAGKEANASFFSVKCPSEPNIEESLPNDERAMSAPHDTASFLEVAIQKETSHSMEANKEPIEEQILQVNPEDRSEKHVNLSQYTNVVVSLKEPAEAGVSSQVVSEFPTKLYCNTEGLTSKLPHDNTISLQNPLVEKHTKKMKRKSSKSHKEAHLVMPYETVVVRSPQLTADPHNSGKEANASIFSGKYATEPSIEESLPNDERDMSTAHDIASFLEVANQKESRHSMEINNEPIEEHILHVNPEYVSEKHVNSGQDTSVNVSLKEPAEARVSSQVANEFPTKIYCSTDKFNSQPIKPKEANDQESRECYATKCITDLNLREAGSVDAKAGISASVEKLPYQEQTTNAVSNLKGANKDCFFAKVDSKGLSKSQRRRKKSKAESSRVSESTELNGNKDHLISDNAQVSLNDAQNESNAAKFIKQADQKANGGHSVDTMIKISPSSKKVPYQDEVHIMNSGNPPISMPNNLSEVSNAFVEQAAEIRVPSQTSSEVQAKLRRSRKKSKSEPSKLGSQQNCDVVLPKFNGEVTESNEERGPDPSKLANESNQKIELHCMDAKVKVPLSDENSSKLVKVPQVNPLESSSAELQDFSEQSNAKIIIKGNVTQYEALAGPTKSMCDRKKSKKETLKAQVSSEMSEPKGLCRPDNSTINFDDYYVPREGKHSPSVHAVDPPSRKSETRKKNKTGRKTDINQPYQDSPTNLVQPSSHKQHMAIGHALENDTNHDTVDAVQDTATKDSETGIVRKGKNTKQSSKQNSSFDRIESDSSLHKAHDKHKLDKKLQNYVPESHVQLSKSDKQGRKITTDGKEKTQSFAPDHDIDIDNMVSKDGVRYNDLNSSTISNLVGDAVGSNNFDVSQSEVMASEVASTDSTEDTPHQKSRYRVVRKFSSGKSEKITNNSNPEKSLLASSGRIFNDASVTSSESENEPYKKKAASVTSSGDSDNHLEKVQTKASALKLRMNRNSFGAESDESDEISKEADGRTKNHSRSDASTQKMPLSFILKSSISYRKSKLTASQSEFPDAENQPIDVVLETQPESAAP